jgi:uncharacterized repeat protein (TIGR02543 family)
MGRLGFRRTLDSTAAPCQRLGCRQHLAITHYTVSFNANGGSGAPSAQTKWYDETLALSSTTPTRTGYTFNGWNTKSDGSGTNYAAGGSYTGNAALTLYAKWTPITYTITYKSNYTGGAADQTQSKTYGVNATIKAASTFSRTHYSFTSWNTAANGSGTTVTADSTYSTNAALTLCPMADNHVPNHIQRERWLWSTSRPDEELRDEHNPVKTAPSRTGYSSLDGPRHRRQRNQPLHRPTTETRPSQPQTWPLV